MFENIRLDGTDDKEITMQRLHLGYALQKFHCYRTRDIDITIF